MSNSDLKVPFTMTANELYQKIEKLKEEYDVEQTEKEVTDLLIEFGASKGQLESNTFFPTDFMDPYKASYNDSLSSDTEHKNPSYSDLIEALSAVQDTDYWNIHANIGDVLRDREYDFYSKKVLRLISEFQSERSGFWWDAATQRNLEVMQSNPNVQSIELPKYGTFEEIFSLKFDEAINNSGKYVPRSRKKKMRDCLFMITYEDLDGIVHTCLTDNTQHSHATKNENGEVIWSTRPKEYWVGHGSYDAIRVNYYYNVLSKTWEPVPLQLILSVSPVYSSGNDLPSDYTQEKLDQISYESLMSAMGLADDPDTYDDGYEDDDDDDWDNDEKYYE